MDARDAPVTASGAEPPSWGEWAECLLPPTDLPPAIAADVRRLIGRGPAFVPRLAHAPWVALAVARVLDGPLAYISRELAERIGLVVAQDNSCRYCYGTLRALLRVSGRSEVDVDRIVRDSLATDLTPAERVAVDYARRVARANPRPGRAELQAVVAAGVDPRAAVEVAAQTAFASFMNRMATLVALPQEPLEALTASPFFRIVRPLVAWSMRHKAKQPQPPPQPNDGPCARVVAALGDSPAAHVVRATIDDAWASPILPARTKALVVAVIARGLECAYGESEARGLLGREGFSADDIDEVLTTLASPRLDPREARLVPFARETIRYQPLQIQRGLRELCCDLGPAETMEMIGIVSLANAVCRLSVVLDAC
jgi:AhpD family alkylhydroperoxidase